MKKILLVICAIFLMCPSVMAKEVNHFVSKADNDLTVENTYNSSVAMAGESVNFEGQVDGIGAFAGNKVIVDGSVEYGAFAGNNITVNGTVLKDGFIAGNLITTSEKAIFNRDAIIAGNDVELNGNFERNVSIYASKVTLKNVTINGNIKLYTESITVSKDATVNGTLYYPEDSQYTEKEGAVVNSTEKTAAIQLENEENFFTTLAGKIWSFLGLAFIFGALSLFFPTIFNNINEKYAKFDVSEGVSVFTKGIVAFIIIPVIIILLLFTMIGIPLAIILLLLYGIAIYLTTIFTAYLIGYKIWQKVFDKDVHILFFGIIGLVILLILEIIPGVRILVSIISVLVGLGLILETIKK